MMNKSEFKEQAKNHLDIIFNKIENLESRKHKIPEDALEKCILMALTYHTVKDLPRLGQ